LKPPTLLLWCFYICPIGIVSSNAILLQALPDKAVFRFNDGLSTEGHFPVSALSLAHGTLNLLVHRDSLLHDFDAVCTESDVSL
jgi:hypothetical protein